MTPRRSRPLALLYIRVSSTMQAETGASLEAQRNTLVAEAERRGWDWQVVEEAARSGKNLTGRPALLEALDKLDRHKADHLLAIRLDRVSRSVRDFTTLVERAQKRGWGLVLLSPNIDLSDAAGRFTANVLASAAQYERELLSQRTKEGMAQRAAEGVTFGRAVEEDYKPVYAHVRALRESGLSLRKIVAKLTADGIPTAQGGAWHLSTVVRILESKTLATI